MGSHTRTLDRKRVFPATPATAPKTVQLSIIDATVVRFDKCAAIWFFDRPQDDETGPARFARLENALAGTLDDHRQFAGHLRWATADFVRETANPRHLGRPVATYGTADDPGVDFVVAEDHRRLEDLIPAGETRSAQRVWTTTGFTETDFMVDEPLGLSGLRVVPGRPSMSVQLTGFACGGFAVAMALTHCLSDATTLIHFAKLWAARSRDVQDGETLEPPLFNPGLLDRCAALDGTTTPNTALVEKARDLPMHRYDWWATDAPGYPSWGKASSAGSMPSAEKLATMELSPSTHQPWPTWRIGEAVDAVQIRFSAEEVAWLKASGEATLPPELDGHRIGISRLDAVLAHVWILVNRARLLQDESAVVHLDMTLGLRHRVNPPLPETWSGSATALCHASLPGGQVCGMSLGGVAALLRQTTARFTSDAVAAHLHDAAHEVSPQRLWQAFLGREHLLVTSWVRLGAYGVRFGQADPRPRCAWAVMPRLDGLMHVVDVNGQGDLDVALCLERETMERLLRDPVLTTFS